MDPEFREEPLSQKRFTRDLDLLDEVGSRVKLEGKRREITMEDVDRVAGTGDA